MEISNLHFILQFNTMTVLTRSQCRIQSNKIKVDKPKIILNQENVKTINIELEVNIDFDESSKEWRKNKHCIGNGQFKYIKNR
jgi:uncharacterized protein involved in outer membrane biogenesis